MICIKLKCIYKILVFTLFTLLLLASCNRNTKTAIQYSPGEIAETIIMSQKSISVLLPLNPQDDYFAIYFSDIYEIEPDLITDGIIYYADGMLADEITVLVTDESNVGEVFSALLNYKEKRLDAFIGYAPEQAAILEKSVVVKYENYIALLICPEPQNAEDTFFAYFNDHDPEMVSDPGDISSENDDPTETNILAADITELYKEAMEETKTEIFSNAETQTYTSDVKDENLTEIPYTEESIPVEEIKDPETIVPDNESNEKPEETSVAEENVFNSVDLLEAWRSGDKSQLSRKTMLVLDTCTKIINELVDDGMTDYEKELVIHDWMIEWADYDREANNNAPDAKPDPDNFNPYGLIIQKKAICSGYTSAFQLFMDMLEIDCISVFGSSGNTGREHAWNMVRIDGEWYCVDVTWNDYFGEDRNGTKTHRYFNVTSKYMRTTKHQWDESKTPLADAKKLYID